jgi:hypothetical protein
LTPGEPISVSVPLEEEGVEAHVVVPGGDRRPLPLSSDGETLQGVFRDTRALGFYRVELGGHGAQDDRELVARASSKVFAVNLPPEESRLERLSEEALADLRSLGIEVFLSASDVAPSSVAEEVKIEQWPGALALAVLLLFAELFLARSFARGREPWRRGGAERQLTA